MKSLFIKKLLEHFFYDGLAFAFVGYLVWANGFNIFLWVPAYFILGMIAAYQAAVIMMDDQRKQYNDDLLEKEKNVRVALKETELARHDESLWKQSLKEKSSGFPTLMREIDELSKLRDKDSEQYLRYKSHPSRKGAEVVREEAGRRRRAEYENKVTQSIIEYYESIAPFLVDLKNEIVDDTDDQKFKDFSEEELQDPVTNFLTKEEFRKLSSVERNQIALDRFWARPKSKWLIGRIYERFVGYLYEIRGYTVEYVGIFKGFEDLGRDLICQKDNEFIIIQCKYWSQFKTIYEKHIFQFFGTVFQYKDENPDRKVNAIFYTTTKLSDLARRFANELKIELREDFKFDKDYPSIKCNVSMIDGTKIYHLPFDQQYDNVKVEKKRGEFYCASVKEAEDKGFRRAFRWRGNNNVQ